MRALKYRLENGTVVNSMSQANASGQKYEVFFEEVREANRENISPIRKAMLEQFEAWRNGELIQNAMPDLTFTEREQLISGLCLKCQAEMFGE